MSDEHVKAAQALATVVVAVYVASIGTFQWRTAQEKLRLDLYNRRFEVYVQVITFMQTLMSWVDVPENERIQKRIPFVRAVRESRFLFASDPAVLALLEEMYNRSFVVTGFWEVATPLSGVFPEQYIQEYENKQRNLEWIMEAPSKLETLLLPFLAFHQKGFTKFGFLRRYRNRKGSSKPNRRESPTS